MNCKQNISAAVLKNKYLMQWWNTSPEFPAFNRTYSPKLQLVLERKMDSIIEQMLAEVKLSFNTIEKEYFAWGSRLRSLLQIIGDEILELGGKGTEILLNGGYCEVTSDFIDRARSFDAEVKTSDIMQAMRNAWIMNCIQVLMSREVAFTPALFAYSMLYPYTDNYLDSKEISREEKLQYGDRFRLRLEGKPVLSRNAYEEKIFKLVGMIESQYTRDCFPCIYEWLLEIHDAQQKSLMQHKDRQSPYESDIAGLSFAKGGASVLADAFLVNGHLTQAQAEFMFGFGIFLQLADDAQDVQTDCKNGHMTMFSQTADKWCLDGVMNKLINFMFNLLEKDECFKEPEMLEHKRLITDSCTLLLISAAANNYSKYSNDYIKKLERHSPFRFAYLRKLYKKAGKEFIRLFGENSIVKMDSLIARALVLGQ